MPVSPESAPRPSTALPGVGRRPRIPRVALATLCAGALVAPLASTIPAVAQEYPELIVNGTFDDGTTGWNAYPDPEVVDGRACMTVPAGSGPYAAGLIQEVPLEAGETYELSFEALSEPANDVNLQVVVQGGPDINYKQFLPAQRLTLSPDATEFSYTFTPDIDYGTAELGLQQSVGNDTAYQFCADNFSLRGGAEEEEYVPDTGPLVRVNQVGYLPTGPKRATVVSEATEPQPWQLRDADDAVVAEGLSTPEGLDPSAGVSVHTVDFTAYEMAGEGLTLTVGEETSYPFAIGTDLYDDLRTQSKTFYYTNRSGIAIDDDLAPGYGREAGHVGVAPNQGDTAVPCLGLDDDSQVLYDEPWTCEGTRDVTGGWYDAGDHGKYVVNAGISAAQLMMEYERHLGDPEAAPGLYDDGTLAIPEAGNGTPDLLDEVRWELEWMMKMQVPAGVEYAGMANHKMADVDWTGLPMLPADDPMERVLFRPSTAATLNLAAAAAQGARLFAEEDPEFADELLASARTAYDAAEQTPELYAPEADPALDPNPGSGPYNDDDATDEFYWAAAELFLTTGEQGYRDAVLDSPHHTSDIFTGTSHDWGHVAALGRLDLATVASDLPDRARVQQSVVEGADGYLADQTSQPFGQPYAPDDGVYAWGSNSTILNNLQVVGTAYDLTGRPQYAAGVLEGMDYIFGRNALNVSYVTGYGEVFAQNQHSRWYANQLDPSLPQPPTGTVSGGPNSDAVATGDPVAAAYLQGCAAQFCYIDDIGSWSTNEITVNWNSAMSWVSGFLADVEEIPEIGRLAGADRYATAAEVAASYPDGADTVYVVSGDAFADALGAGPAANAAGVASGREATQQTPQGDAAPVLLTRSDALPEATVEALDALEPAAIVVLGGDRAIGDPVVDALRQWGTVERIGGATRYDTSAMLAQRFGAGVETVYVASGADASFADALSGGALAGTQGAPLLLTRPDRVDPATQRALDRLGAQEVVVLGGPGAVSGLVFDELGADRRIAGSDRFDTSAQVAQEFPADIEAAYLASGRAWPDALTGSALAGHRAVPLLLSDTADVPDVVMTALQRLSPAELTVVGGLVPVARAVEDELYTAYPAWAR